MSNEIKTIVDLEDALYDVIRRTNARITPDAHNVFEHALKRALFMYAHDESEYHEIEQEYYTVKHKEG